MEYIYYLQNRIFDLEMAVSTGDVEDNINSDDTDSQQQLCTSPYCKCPYHKNNGPPPPSPPPPSRRRQAWEDTVEKVQLSLLGGITAKCITASYNDVRSFELIYIP